MKDNRRLKVLATIPVVDGYWTQLPDDRKRSHTHQLIAATIDVIEEEGREPDNFEALDLKSAMAAMQGCMYTAAVTFVQRALAPSRDRNGCSGFRGDLVATTRDLRAQLASLKPAAQAELR